jgi:hypothetical protein
VRLAGAAMSQGLYPIFDTPVDRGEFLGEALALEYSALESAAERAGVRLLSDYSGWPDFEVPDDFDGDPDDLRALRGPPTWHDPEHVRRAIAAIRTRIAGGDDAFAVADRGHVDAELVALDTILQSAARCGARVYLDII